MATNRTATTDWRKIRDEAKAIAREQGLTNCPRCHVWLEWEHGRKPNSPEADHITPHARGGASSLENTRIICRRCNQQLGGALKKRKPRPVIETVELESSPIW